MESDFTAYLERVRSHRGELGEAMAALTAALEAPADSTHWRRRVRAALTELAHDVRTHVELTEAPGGLYDEMRAREPRLAGGIAGQLTDHAHLLAEVDRLLDDRDGGQAALDAEGHREAVTALLTRLVRHRARGARLVHEAYDVDLGGSG
jgi:hypothetical protein